MGTTRETFGDRLIALLREVMGPGTTEDDRIRFRIYCSFVVATLHLNDVGLPADCQGAKEITMAMNNVGWNLSRELARLHKKQKAELEKKQS